MRIYYRGFGAIFIHISMASAVIFQTNLTLPCCFLYKKHAFSPSGSSQFHPSNSISVFPNPSLLKTNKLKTPKNGVLPVVFAAHSDLLRVIQRVWKVVANGVEIGTSLVPSAIPRPVARISVAVIGGALALFVLQSFLSTAFFALAVMGLCYFTFLALNKDEGPKGGDDTSSSTEDSLEEARRIMEKYK